MDNLSLWGFLPMLIIAFTSNMKSRTRNIYAWCCIWTSAGWLAFCLWRLYKAWRIASAVNDPGYPTPFPHILIWGPVLVVFLMALPVLWYYRNLHKERLAGKADMTA